MAWGTELVGTSSVIRAGIQLVAQATALTVPGVHQVYNNFIGGPIQLKPRSMPHASSKPQVH